MTTLSISDQSNDTQRRLRARSDQMRKDKTSILDGGGNYGTGLIALYIPAHLREDVIRMISAKYQTKHKNGHYEIYEVAK